VALIFLGVCGLYWLMITPRGEECWLDDKLIV
jgi:hypothetical protein